MDSQTGRIIIGMMYEITPLPPLSFFIWKGKTSAVLWWCEQTLSVMKYNHRFSKTPPDECCGLSGRFGRGPIAPHWKYRMVILAISTRQFFNHTANPTVNSTWMCFMDIRINLKVWPSASPDLKCLEFICLSRVHQWKTVLKSVTK